MTRPADIYLRFLQLAEALPGQRSSPLPLDPLEARILELVARTEQVNERLSGSSSRLSAMTRAAISRVKSSRLRASRSASPASSMASRCPPGRCVMLSSASRCTTRDSSRRSFVPKVCSPPSLMLHHHQSPGTGLTGKKRCFASTAKSMFRPVSPTRRRDEEDGMCGERSQRNGQRRAG